MQVLDLPKVREFVIELLLRRLLVHICHHHDPTLDSWPRGGQGARVGREKTDFPPVATRLFISVEQSTKVVSSVGGRLVAPETHIERRAVIRTRLWYPDGRMPLQHPWIRPQLSHPQTHERGRVKKREERRSGFVSPPLVVLFVFGGRVSPQERERERERTDFWT